jgi:hypothetical protein
MQSDDSLPQRTDVKNSKWTVVFKNSTFGVFLSFPVFLTVDFHEKVLFTFLSGKGINIYRTPPRWLSEISNM